jgi:sodium-dependent dicarboxylate transporter 2/3/5
MEGVRRRAGRWWNQVRLNPSKTTTRWAFVLIAVLAAALLPNSQELSPKGWGCLVVATFAGSLWLSDLLPAAVVGLLVIGLSALLLMLGESSDPSQSTPFSHATLQSASYLWLLVVAQLLAIGAQKTQVLNYWLCAVMPRLSERPWWILAGVMSFCFFVGGLITRMPSIAIAFSIMLPVIHSLAGGDPLRKGLTLGIAASASIGSLVFLLGNPINLMAYEACAGSGGNTHFLQWTLVVLLPAVLILAASWGYLLLRYPAWVERVDFARKTRHVEPLVVSVWHQSIYASALAIPLLLWLTSQWHGVPTAAIALLPVMAMIGSGMIGLRDLKELPWEHLVLLASGLALTLLVIDSGLSSWLAASLLRGGPNTIVPAILLCFGTSIAVGCANRFSMGGWIAPVAIAAPAAAAMTSDQHLLHVLPVAISAVAVLLPNQREVNKSLQCFPSHKSLSNFFQELSRNDLMEMVAFLGVVSPLIATACCRLFFG